MANEAIKVELTNEDGFPRRYTVASQVAISKGTLLRLVDSRTASGVITTSCPCAGIALMQKEANDFSTSISVWTDGVFEMVASSAIVIGSPVACSALANKIWTPSRIGTASGAQIIGYALEAADADETINVRVRL